MTDSVVWFDEVGRVDVATVGGKNASLGEMVSNLASSGVPVPPGFATTAAAYWRFVEANGLNDEIAKRLEDHQDGKSSLAETGSAVRGAFLAADWPEDIAEAIRGAYEALSHRMGKETGDVAVRSSATA